jgi:hypothetical protein
MNVTDMLNSRAHLAVHQFPGFLGSQSHLNHHHFPLIKSESDMERSVSPHGSEHSQYSTSNMSRSYASPGPMHTMHMPNPMQTQMSLPPFPEMPGMGNVPNMGMQQMHHQEPHVHVHMPPKSYPCGTCSKRFARRSDLARHGKFFGLSFSFFSFRLLDL